MKKRRRIKCLLLTAFATLFIIFLSVSTMDVYASSYLIGISEKSLYNETNTYDISNECFDDKDVFLPYIDVNGMHSTEIQHIVKYDLSKKNANTVMSYPQITVLTPGLGSHASVWSNAYTATNSYDFAYDDQSLIAKITNFAGSANIYWTKMKYIDKNIGVGSGYSFDIFDITDQTIQGMKYEDAPTQLINNIVDISKHIIMVFDPVDAGESNNNIYYQFNYALSKMIYDVKILNGGILPKVNLIGHSRGGLTNLQYALDHPDLVESLISIDTPYFSSTTANLFGEAFMGENDGLVDILNPDVYYDYNKRWNDNYDTLYKDIKVSAYGTYHTLASLSEVVFNDNSGTISELGATGITTALAALNVAKLVTATNYLGEQLVLGLISECLDIFLPASKVVDAAEILFKEINFDVYPAFVSWYNDILVDLDSQLGLDSGNLTAGTGSFKGFNRIIRPFIGGSADSVDYTKVAQNNVPVGHNLVTRDSVIINSIVCGLKLGGDYGLRLLDVGKI